MIRNETLEERRLFTYEERKATLRRSRNKCACCGTPLTTKTMTMDHVIPISRGGTNDLKNLVALCYDCNQLKGNLLYRPESYYISSVNDSMYFECQTMFHEWFDTIYKDFQLELYPLISPKFLTLFSPIQTNHHRKPIVVSRQLMLEYRFIGRDWEEEASAITGINISGLRSDTNMLAYNRYLNHPVAIYAMTKVSSMKYLALISVLLNREKHELIVYMPWSDLSDSYRPEAMYYFTKFLLESLVSYAHERIDQIILYAHDEKSLLHFGIHRHYTLLGIAGTRCYEENVDGIGTVIGMRVMRHFCERKNGPEYDSRRGFVKNDYVSPEHVAHLREESNKLLTKLEHDRTIAEARYAAAHNTYDDIN